MKRIVFYIGCLMVIGFCRCGLPGSKSADGFDEILQKAPFKPVSDSIEKSPADVNLLLRRAELLTQNNQHDIAYYDYKKSWELAPAEPVALLFTSNLFLTGRNKEAVDLLKKCMQLYPANTEFMRRLGEAYTQTGNAEAALALYDELLKKDSSNFEALYEKGMLYTQMKDTVHAIAMLEKSYAKQPVLQNGIALANLYAETSNIKVIALCNALEQRDTARDFTDPVS